MADEVIVNSAITDTDDTHNAPPFSKDNNYDDALVAELNRKIEVYEEEKSELIGDNQEKLEKMKLLTDEIDGLKAKETKMTQKLEKMEEVVQQSDQDKRALQAITNRAAELEMEVSRLQYDLISSMSGSEKTVRELKAKVGELEGESLAREERIKRLEKEKNDSIRVIEEANKLSVDKDAEIVVLVVEKEELVREVEEVKRLKESEIGVLAKGKKELDEELGKAKRRLEEIEKKVKLIEIELEEAKKTVVVNGDVEEEVDIVPRSSASVLKSLNHQWAASAVVVSTAVVAALYYVHYSRRN